MIIVNMARLDIMNACGGVNIFMSVKYGDKNHGSYVTLSSQSNLQLQRSIKSYTQNVIDHKNKIQAPADYIRDWASRDERYKKGVIKRWEKDLNKNNEQLLIAQSIAKERGI